MPSSWTDNSDRQLLLSIIHDSAVATPKWDRIAEMMGEGYTASALRYRSLPPYIIHVIVLPCFGR